MKYRILFSIAVLAYGSLVFGMEHYPKGSNEGGGARVKRTDAVTPQNSLSKGLSIPNVPLMTLPKPKQQQTTSHSLSIPASEMPQAKKVSAAKNSYSLIGPLLGQMASVEDAINIISLLEAINEKKHPNANFNAAIHILSDCCSEILKMKQYQQDMSKRSEEIAHILTLKDKPMNEKELSEYLHKAKDFMDNNIVFLNMIYSKLAEVNAIIEGIPCLPPLATYIGQYIEAKHLSNFLEVTYKSKFKWVDPTKESIEGAAVSIGLSVGNTVAECGTGPDLMLRGDIREETESSRSSIEEEGEGEGEGEGEEEEIADNASLDLLHRIPHIPAELAAAVFALDITDAWLQDIESSTWKYEVEDNKIVLKRSNSSEPQRSYSISRDGRPFGMDEGLKKILDDLFETHLKVALQKEQAKTDDNSIPVWEEILLPVLESSKIIKAMVHDLFSAAMWLDGTIKAYQKVYDEIEAQKPKKNKLQAIGVHGILGQSHVSSSTSSKDKVSNRALLSSLSQSGSAGNSQRGTPKTAAPKPAASKRRMDIGKLNILSQHSIQSGSAINSQRGTPKTAAPKPAASKRRMDIGKLNTSLQPSIQSRSAGNLWSATPKTAAPKPADSQEKGMNGLIALLKQRSTSKK